MCVCTRACMCVCVCAYVCCCSFILLSQPAQTMCRTSAMSLTGKCIEVCSRERTSFPINPLILFYLFQHLWITKMFSSALVMGSTGYVNMLQVPWKQTPMASQQISVLPKHAILEPCAPVHHTYWNISSAQILHLLQTLRITWCEYE